MPEDLLKRLHTLLYVQLLLCFSGHIFINKHKQYIYCASQVLYYGLTTLSRLQTLGEEYTKIVQVGKSGKHVPGFLVTIC